MKPKKISKKLTLNKSTVAVLNGNEGKKVKGGAGYTYPMTTVHQPCDCNTLADCQPCVGNTNGPCTEQSICDCQTLVLSDCTDPYCC
jgi:hypothetical protein